MAAGFLSRATFGASDDAVDAAVGRSAVDILRTEFAKPITPALPPMEAIVRAGERVPQSAINAHVWNAFISGDDQLRQRVVFALSQIVVANDPQAPTMAYYYDVLQTHAFGNYRDLLRDVTYTPAMARWLTYLHNRKTIEREGNSPDENYARELLQLFSIGTEMLEMDGTVVRGDDGAPIETYTTDDIVGLARVFTGLGRKSAGNFYHSDIDGEFRPLEIDPRYHSELEKSFLGTTIPAGTPGEQSIDMAIDAVFAHPNVAPFISRQLIQRLTQSAPPPDYVRRVADAFETGLYTTSGGDVFGSGRRGDLEATVAAILLDPQFFDSVPSTAREGKVREPVLQFVHWARAFEVADADAARERELIANANNSDKLAQSPLESKSVFNFYRPGYIARGTATGEAGLTAPEFQILHESHFVPSQNFFADYVFDQSFVSPGDPDGFTPDYGDEIALAGDVPALVDHLDTYVLGGNLDAVSRARMVETVSAIDAGERELRARVAVFMAVTSPAFVVDH